MPSNRTMMPSIAIFATLVLAGTLVLGAPVEDAAKPGDRYDPRAAFAETDTDTNGAVDRGEFNARVIEIFYFADADKDGVLSPAEQKRLVFPDDFKDVDKDADGRLSLREFLRVRFADFDVVDADRDGMLSVEEVVVTYGGKAR